MNCFLRKIKQDINCNNFYKVRLININNSIGIRRKIKENKGNWKDNW